jgi:hypothetical protein
VAHDLTATAESNSPARKAAAADILAADASGRLANFRQLVDGSSFSTNVSADKVLAFNQAGDVLDTRRFHIQKAGFDPVAGLADFTTGQRDLLVRREAFEDLWHHGRGIVYGAVNAGGMGTEGRFGPFCLTSSHPDIPVPDALAVFPGDSAHRYTTEAGDVNADLARAEATAWSHRVDLAVIERWSEALAVPETGWADVVCRSDRYLEVTRAGSTRVADLHEVRVRAAYRSELVTLRVRFIAGEPLTSDELAQVGAYDVVREWRRTSGVGLVDVT